MYYRAQCRFAKKLRLKRYIFFLLLLLAAASCKQIDVFEKTVPFPTHSWKDTYKPSFEFTITDTASLYNLFVVIRHTDAYHYNNIWLNLTIVPPGDTAQTVRANLKLGDNRKWLGNSIDDIIEHRILINTNPLRFKKGNYKFILQEIMRENPLPDILMQVYVWKKQELSSTVH